eukprot:TRINITY_DN11168_c0_g1_i1.p1 TRINITY_DN11168_c0_g1~~TRINITY_DN11168_c0_g1_i1.p1  ORF type:complete len:329 (-),score=79.02 TRINITY_DN11168_c0_g1_i1:163-1149(-)
MTGSGSQGTFKGGLLLGALVATALLSIALIVLNGNQDGSLSGASFLGGGDRALVEMALERYKLLARNMSLRLETAEQSVRELNRRQEALSKGKPIGKEKVTIGPAPARPAPPAPPADDKDRQQETKEETKEETEEPEEPEEPEETEEERQKRVEAEEKEQKELIQYDEIKKTFRRYRGDYKCGNKVPPLPDADASAVECEPGFKAPCCSALGWCGRSAEHCTCEMCADYSHKVKVTFGELKLIAPKRECETPAENIGEFKTPEECARQAIVQKECGNSIMFSESYPEWGCRCCAIDTPPAEQGEGDLWSVYQFTYTVEPADVRDEATP